MFAALDCPLRLLTMATTANKLKVTQISGLTAASLAGNPSKNITRNGGLVWLLYYQKKVLHYIALHWIYIFAEKKFFSCVVPPGTQHDLKWHRKHFWLCESHFCTSKRVFNLCTAILDLYTSEKSSSIV